MKTKKAFSALPRILLALVFIFSGFVKGVDPWGTAIKLDEYFQAFSLDFLSGGRYILSIAQSGAEMLLGFCLLFRLGGRLTAILSLWVMVFFTLLTLLLALWNPVSDCGCFGDAVKLTNWQTFFKNLVLLGLALWLVLGERPSRDAWEHARSRAENSSPLVGRALGFCFLLFSAGVGLYSLRHLPLIDFLPYKAGTYLPARLEQAAGGPQREAVLIYRDRQSGQVEEFSLRDTTWQDSVRWEFVDTRFVDLPDAAPKNTSVEEPLDFALLGAEGNAAPTLLGEAGPWFLVTRDALSDPDERIRQRYADVIAYARTQGIPLYGATPAALPDDRMIELSGEEVFFYNIDGTTLKTLIRAHDGLVLFQDGVLLSKWNARDIPAFSEEYAGRGPLAYLAQSAVQGRLRWLLGVFGALLLLTYVVYFCHKKY